MPEEQPRDEKEESTDFKDKTKKKPKKTIIQKEIITIETLEEESAAESATKSVLIVIVVVLVVIIFVLTAYCIVKRKRALKPMKIVKDGERVESQHDTNEDSGKQYGPRNNDHLNIESIMTSKKRPTRQPASQT